MPSRKPSPRYLYVFLDEAGNLDFSPNGTKYFVLTSITKERPFQGYQNLTDLKYDLVEFGLNIEYFHATEDRQAVRGRVFEIIAENLSKMRVDSVVIEKRKTGPALREDMQFYPRMLGYLLKYVLENHDLSLFEEVIVFTDRLPVRKKRSGVEKAVKMTLSNMLPADVSYRVLHHASKSNVELQMADYCNWAIYRKWDRGDERSYEIIASAIKSEFDIFRNGTRCYY